MFHNIAGPVRRIRSPRTTPSQYRNSATAAATGALTSLGSRRTIGTHRDLYRYVTFKYGLAIVVRGEREKEGKNRAKDQVYLCCTYARRMRERERGACRQKDGV